MSMRSVIRLLIALCAALAQPALGQQVGPTKSPPSSGPTWQVITPKRTEPVPVRIEPEVLDLGDLRPDVTVPGEFRITNTGSEPLTITAAMSTCSCTVAQLAESGIRPGQTVVLPITFYSGKTLANQEREVVIRFEGYSKPAAARIRASTHYGVRTTIHYEPPDQRRLATVTLETPDGVPFRVLSANAQPPEFVDGFNPTTDSPRNRYIVAFDLAGTPPELLPRWFVYELDHTESPIVDIPVEDRETVEDRMLRPWSFNEKRLLLGTLPPLVATEVVLTLDRVNGGGLDFVRSIWLEPAIATASIFGMEQTDNALRIRVRIEPLEEFRGPFVTTLHIANDEHQEGITLMGRIAEPETSP